MRQIHLLLGTAFFSKPINGFQLAFKAKDSPMLAHAPTTIDDLPVHTTVQSTIDLLTNFKELPSCNRLAAASLLHSCASLESPAGNILEDVKTVYATRLAVCELIDAHVGVPEACAAFKPSTSNVRNVMLRGFVKNGHATEPTLHYSSYEADTEVDFDACTQALYSTSQGWTSFSNSKQNALFTCHTMRASFEKDDLIKTFANVTNISEDAAQSLASAVKAFQDHRDLFEEFGQSIAALRDDFATELDAILHGSTSHFETALSAIVPNVDHLRQAAELTMLDVVAQSEEMHQLFSAVKQNYDWVNGRLASLGDSIDVHRSSVDRSAGVVEDLNTVVNGISDTVSGTTQVLNSSMERLRSTATESNEAMVHLLNSIVSLDGAANIVSDILGSMKLAVFGSLVVISVFLMSLPFLLMCSPLNGTRSVLVSIGLGIFMGVLATPMIHLDHQIHKHNESRRQAIFFSSGAICIGTLLGAIMLHCVQALCYKSSAETFKVQAQNNVHLDNKVQAAYLNENAQKSDSQKQDLDLPVVHYPINDPLFWQSRQRPAHWNNRRAFVAE